MTDSLLIYPDISVQVDKNEILEAINNSIHQVTMDLPNIQSNLSLLLNCNLKFNDINDVIHNLCLREINMEILEIICVIYLRSINFNIEYFLNKNSIIEKHNLKKIFNIKTVNKLYIEPLLNQIHIFKDKLTEYNVRMLRFYCTYLLFNKDVIHQFDILYFISYIINYDTLILSNWIKYKPTQVKWDILGLQTIKNFTFTELKYVKSIDLLFDIKLTYVNYKFLDYIIKKTNYNEDFFNLIICSFNQDYDIQNMFNILNKVKGNLFVFNSIIYELMKKDKNTFNTYFINTSNLQNHLNIYKSNINLIKLLKVNNVEIKYLKQLVYDYKNFKLILKKLNNPYILLKELEFTNDQLSIKKLIFLYSYIDISKELFYNIIIQIISKCYKEFNIINKSSNCYNKSNPIPIDSTYIYSIEEKNNCKCILKNISLLIKLFFVYNNSNMSTKFIKKLYKMNKKKFIKYYHIMEPSTLQIKIYKLLKINVIIKDKEHWWNKLIYSKINNINLYAYNQNEEKNIENKTILNDLSLNNMILDDYKYMNYVEFNNTYDSNVSRINNFDSGYIRGLYFKKSHMEFTTESDFFTLNISFLRLEYEEQQTLVQINNLYIYVKQNCLIIYSNSYEKIVKIDDDNKIYLEIKYKKKNITINSTISFKFSLTNNIFIKIGQDFKGCLEKMLFFESVNYDKSRIKNLDGSDLYLKLLRPLEMWCANKCVIGMFVDNVVPYILYKGREIKFYNILCVR